jgi:NADH:ubiquinone oxidoreductase subunit 2 (subunit N)
MLNAGVAAFYYLNVVRSMFFGSDESVAANPAMPVSLSVQIALVVCVAATLWIGIYPPNVIGWANDASRQLLALVL